MEYFKYKVIETKCATKVEKIIKKWAKKGWRVVGFSGAHIIMEKFSHNHIMMR